MKIGASKVVPDPCNLDFSNPKYKLTPQQRIQFVDRIVNCYQSPLCPEWARLDEDFHVADLNASKLEWLFNLIDQVRYGGKLIRDAKEKHNIDIVYYYHKFKQVPPKKFKKDKDGTLVPIPVKILTPEEKALREKLLPSAKTSFYADEESEKKELFHVVFHFNINRFGDSARCRVTNGIKVRHKLEALITTILHEMAHFWLRLACNTPQGHNHRFKSYNHHINGAHPHKIGFHDLNSCPVQEKYSKRRKENKQS